MSCHRITTISLLGNNSININSLEGNKEYVELDDEINEINKGRGNTELDKVREKIFEKLMKPLLKYQFEVVKNNYYLIEFYTLELQRLEVYTEEDKNAKKNYLELLNFIAVANNSNEKLQKFNVQELGQSLGYSINVSSVTLKAEYLIYDSILGKPEKFKYEKKFLNKIREIIEKSPDIDFDLLKKKVKQYYYMNL